MKKHLHLVLTMLVLWFACQSSAFSQDCSLLAPGSEAGFDQKGFCAPVTAQVTFFTFYTLKPIPKNKLGAEVNWGDGKKIQYAVDDSLGLNANGVYEYRVYNAEYEYAADRKSPKCSYPISVQAFVKDAKGKNIVCSSPRQAGTVIVWDKDNANGGNLLLDPSTYYACPGTEFTVDFADNSSWNCVPPTEKTNVNWPSRTTQFVYGTQNTITGSVQIDDQPISGFPFEGAQHVYAEKAGGPSAPHNTSARISIPATAQVGEKFEVTLNNWNYCNQQPNAPVQRKAIIEIVAKPVGTISIQNKAKEEATAFCPNEEIRLSGGFYTSTGTVQPEDVRYDWEIVDLYTEAVQKFENKKDLVLKNGFAHSGRQKIILKVSNTKTNGPACESHTEQEILLIDAPKVSTVINESPTAKLDFCAEDLNNVHYPVRFEHTFSSEVDFTFTYHLYKRNSTKDSPDSTLNIQSGSGTGIPETKAVHEAVYKKPGLYRIRLVARNNNTGCSTIEENTVTIYENPVPDFRIESQCAGQPTTLTDQSKASSIPGDKINSWEWDLDYTAENRATNTFEVDKSGKGPIKWTYKAPGTYEVALRVRNEAGCTTIRIQTVEVKEVPKASLSSNYTGELICPGDTIRFFNKSLSLNTAEKFPSGIEYSLLVSDGVATRTIHFSQGQDYLDYSQFFNPFEQVENYTVRLQAKGNEPNTCASISDPIAIKVRNGAAAGYTTAQAYTLFEPNCSPKTIRFVTNEATQALQADRYKWTILQNGKIQEEIILERGAAPFDTLDYTFLNTGIKQLDYDVKLTAEKEGICIAPVMNTFRIYPNPWAEFTASQVQESCDSTIFELKVNMPAGISDFKWKFSEQPSDNAMIGLKDDHYFISFHRPAYGEAPKEVLISLKASNFYGCTGEWNTTVLVQPVNMPSEIAPSFTLDKLSESLPNAYFKINNTTPHAAEWKTSWDFGDGTTSDKVQPGNHQYTASGRFTITLTLSNGSCSKTYSQQVEVIEARPEVAFVPDHIEGCAPLTVQFKNNSKYTDKTSYSWDFGDGVGTSTAVNPSYTYSKAGNYHVSLSALSSNGSQSTLTKVEKVVRVYATPRADFVIRKDVIFSPDEPVYVANFSERAVWYRWDFGDGTVYEGTDQFEPVHYYQQPGVYDISLIVHSQQGCQDTLYLKQAVTARGGGKVIVPNAFTPNLNGPSGGRIENMGINDVFFPVIQGGVLKYHFSVFNRWGELVFESKDMNTGWDGYYKGRLCKSGVYIYKLMAELNDGKIIHQTGDVSLLQ